MIIPLSYDTMMLFVCFALLYDTAVLCVAM